MSFWPGELEVYLLATIGDVEFLDHQFSFISFEFCSSIGLCCHTPE